MDLSLFYEHEARYIGAVLADTWGHLDGKPDESYNGVLIYAVGEYGDNVVIKHDYEPSGIAFLEDVHNFFTKKDLGVGVYKFTGVYKIYKKQNPKGYGFFKGKLETVNID